MLFSSFYVSLQSGGSTKGTDDSVLYIKAISTDNKPRLSFNTFANVWAREEECCEKAINPGEDFELAIVCEHRLYKVIIYNRCTKKKSINVNGGEWGWEMGHIRQYCL